MDMVSWSKQSSQKYTTFRSKLRSFSLQSNTRSDQSTRRRQEAPWSGWRCYTPASSTAAAGAGPWSKPLPSRPRCTGCRDLILIGNCRGLFANFPRRTDGVKREVKHQCSMGIGWPRCAACTIARERCLHPSCCLII
jgi:hypothetical protein